jgi:CheY-like chemotaxis protein
MLERCGYDVVVATNAHEALDLFRWTPQAFPLVMTDQIMPGMTGGELAQHLLQIRAD